MWKVSYERSAGNELRYWLKVNPKKAKKITDLISDILINPTKGIGKPERLKYIDGNVWSRRIDDEHRLIYEITSDTITIKSARYHYER